MSGIYLSYRRMEAGGHAGRLVDYLSGHFGRGSVFRDIDTIRRGEDFALAIQSALNASDVVLVVIGKSWASCTDQDGRRRLDDPNDWVRIEVAAALRRNILVVPVLVDGARLPNPTSLPEELRPLCRRNACELSDLRWAFDVGELVKDLKKVVRPQKKLQILRVKDKRLRWLTGSAIVLVLLLGVVFFWPKAFSVQLAVINTRGDVWARDLDLSGGNVGAGIKLTGPGLFEGQDDQFVVAFLNSIAVITTSGAFRPRIVNHNTIGPGSELSGSLFGGADTKYLLYYGSCNAVFVVNNKGEVWPHLIDATAVGIGSKLNGPTLFGAPNDKYVVYDDVNKRILVINTQGEVWAHDISSSTPNTFCGYDTVSTGYKLNGHGLFGAPNDKYIVCIRSSLLVINTLGEVWASKMTASTIGPRVKLNGPDLFGSTDDKYVVAYLVRLHPPPPPR